jgi:acyl carrier protein
MRDADRASVLAALRDWLVRANAGEEALRLEPDTDIIESRILESLQVVEFILFIEERSGRPILAEGLDPDSLRTLDSIYEHYFEARA